MGTLLPSYTVPSLTTGCTHRRTNPQVRFWPGQAATRSDSRRSPSCLGTGHCWPLLRDLIDSISTRAWTCSPIMVCWVLTIWDYSSQACCWGGTRTHCVRTQQDNVGNTKDRNEINANHCWGSRMNRDLQWAGSNDYIYHRQIRYYDIEMRIKIREWKQCYTENANSSPLITGKMMMQ